MGRSRPRPIASQRFFSSALLTDQKPCPEFRPPVVSPGKLRRRFRGNAPARDQRVGRRTAAIDRRPGSRVGLSTTVVTRKNRACLRRISAVQTLVPCPTWGAFLCLVCRTRFASPHPHFGILLTGQ